VNDGHVYHNDLRGTHLVESSLEDGTFYTINGICECPDKSFREPVHCKHEFARIIQDRTLGMLN